MRIFFILICSFALALATVAQGAKKEDKQKKKKGAKTEQVSKPGARPTATSRGRGATKSATTSKREATSKPARVDRGAVVSKPAKAERRATASKPTRETRQAAATKPAKVERHAVTRERAGKPFKTQRFNLATTTRPTKIQGVKFQQNKRIVGSQNWRGSNYTVFRTYTPVWHDRFWWRSHYNRIVFVFGGWYYWNAGWWYPAWGYAPNAYYAYDGPIYAHNDLPPDQVIANVQAALQEQGYYVEVDGLLGPLTRAAIADYQRDHGLYETAAIDQPTLESLGMA